MALHHINKYLPILTLISLVIVVGIMDQNFFKLTNLIQLTADISTLFILATGITFVIYIGSIDLSVESIANMTTVLVTVLLPNFEFMTAPIVLVIGLLFGVLSGVLTTYFRVPSFISTLAVGGIALSVGQYVSGQRALFMDSSLRQQSFGWMVDSTSGIPNEILLAFGLLIIALFIERRSILGRSLKAIGSGEWAAVASGIHVRRYKILAFGISGLMAAMAGLLFAVKLSGGSPTIASGLLLPAIVAVLVGGTPLTGGVGGTLNTLIGALIVAVVRTSMLYLEIPAQAQQVFFGVVLVIAIALTVDRNKAGIVK